MKYTHYFSFIFKFVFWQTYQFATLATVACTVYSTTFCPYAFIRKSEKSCVQNVVFSKRINSFCFLNFEFLCHLFIEYKSQKWRIMLPWLSRHRGWPSCVGEEEVGGGADCLSVPGPLGQPSQVAGRSACLSSHRVTMGQDNRGRGGVHSLGIPREHNIFVELPTVSWSY